MPPPPDRRALVIMLAVTVDVANPETGAGLVVAEYDNLPPEARERVRRVLWLALDRLAR